MHSFGMADILRYFEWPQSERKKNKWRETLKFPNARGTISSNINFEIALFVIYIFTLLNYSL